MLYVNGKQVNLSNRKEDYEFHSIVEDYHKTIKELRSIHGSAIRFVTKDPIKIDPIFKTALPPKIYSWPTTLKRVTEDGPETWVWSPDGATIKDGVATSTQPNFIISRGGQNYSFDEAPDFIYFLTKHRAVTTKRLRIHDPESLERERANSMRLETKFKDLIYSENSPLFEDIDKLKLIASKWGVPDVDSMSDYAIRNALYDAVMSGQEAKNKRQGEDGVEEFIKDFNFGDSVKIGSTIQRAIDAGCLSFDRNTNEWLLVIDKDQMPLSIMKVQTSHVEKSRTALADYLARNKHDVDIIEKTLKGESVIKYGKVYDKEEVSIPKIVTDIDVDTAKFRDLQKTAGELGLGRESVGKNTEQLRSMVKEKLEEISQNA